MLSAKGFSRAGGWLPRAAGPLLLAAGTLALCLPMLGGANFTPDAAEYAGIARRFAEGHGLTTALKWQFLDHGPVVRPAAIERPILYPLLGGLVLKGAPDSEPLRALQAANAILAAANSIVAAAAFRTVASPAAAWLGAIFLALSPGFTQTATVALSDQLFLLLWLSALAFLPRARGPRGSVLFGFLAGLAALTRPNGVLLALGFALFAWRSGDRRRAAASTAWMLAAMLPVLAPLAHTTLAARGQGIRPGALVNYSVLHIHQASWHGFRRTIPSPAQLIRARPGAVLQAVRGKARTNAEALGASLGPLLLLPLLALLCPLRRRPPAGSPGPRSPVPRRRSPVAGPPLPDTSLPALRWVWLVLALAGFVFYSTSWVAAGAVRYLLPTTALLLPLLLQAGLDASRCSWVPRVLLAAVVVGTIPLLAGHWNTHLRSTRQHWGPAGWETYRIAARWVEAAAAPADVVASNNPWMLHYLTGRPSLACPYFRGGADLAALARTFNVRWVVLIAPPEDARVRHCLQHPAARLARHTTGRGRQELYLFAVAGQSEW